MSQFQEMWPLSGPTGSKTLKGKLTIKDSGHMVHGGPPSVPHQRGIRIRDEDDGYESFELSDEEFAAAMAIYDAEEQQYVKTGGAAWMCGTIQVSGTFEFLDCSKASGVRTADGEWIWNEVVIP